MEPTLPEAFYGVRQVQEAAFRSQRVEESSPCLECSRAEGDIATVHQEAAFNHVALAALKRLKSVGRRRSGIPPMRDHPLGQFVAC